jgi:hypothetical protein
VTRNANISLALAEWGCMCHGADEQAWLVRPVAAGLVDTTDDHRVARLHEHLIGVGDQKDFSARAGEAVQGVSAVRARQMNPLGKGSRCAPRPGVCDRSPSMVLSTGVSWVAHSVARQ